MHGEIKPGKIRKILIPYGGNIHTRLAIEISPALKEYYNANITVAIVFSPNTSRQDRQKITEQINMDMTENNLDANIEIISDPDILHGILKLAENTDLLVMGGRSGDFIEILLARSLVREITEQVRCPVLWLKEYEERESFFKSLFKTQKISG